MISLISLTGCWDRIEVNDMAFVAAAGFDKEADNQFRISVLVPLPSAMGGVGSSGGGGGTSGSKPYYVDSDVGRNIMEAINKLQNHMSRRLYFSHRRVLIIGEKLARGGFGKSLDWILKNPQSRLTTFVLIANGDASEVLNSEPHLEQMPVEAIREMTKEVFNADTRQIVADISIPGKDPVIPIVETIKSKNKNPKDNRLEVSIKNVAILKDDHYRFQANRKETLGTFWLLNQMDNKALTIKVAKKDELIVRVMDSRIQPTYEVKKDVPSFTLSLSTKVKMIQNEPNLKLNDRKIYKEFKKKMEATIKDQIEAILTHSKSEGIDVYGLGWYLYRHENQLWKSKWEGPWDELLKDVKVKVLVNADIEESINSPIKIKE